MDSSFARGLAALLACGLVACTQNANDSSDAMATGSAAPAVAAQESVDGLVVTRSMKAADGSIVGEPMAMEGEFLVKFRPSASDKSAAAVLGKAGAVTKRSYRAVPGLRLVKLAPGARADAMLAALRERDDVEYAEPNYLRRVQAVPDDTDFALQWSLHNTGQTGGVPDADIDAPEAWDIETGSDAVVIAILDTGLDYTHPDLAANMFTNTPECTPNGVDDDGNGYVDDCHGIDTVNGDSNPDDDNNHGTHVAGIIGAAGNDARGISGVAQNVKLLPCKFVGEFGFGSDAGAIECLEYIAELKRRGVNVVASNNSWGGFFPSRAIVDAIEEQLAEGILFIAAAGNTGSDGDHFLTEFPCASYVPNVICVASTDHQDQRTPSSTYGRSRVHISAPGNAIYSTIIDDRYDTFGGTSMATPHVSGVVALLASQGPARDWRALRNLVLSGSDPLATPGITVTESRVNAHKALTCTNSVRLGRLRPIQTDDLILAVGDSIELSALHINCANPNGNVTVTVNPGGQTVTLQDDGANLDQLAGDGIYTATWTAPAAGTFTLSFPETPAEVITIVVDPLLERGFPGYAFGTTGTYMGGASIHVMAGNVDTDPELEVFATGLASGPLYAWNHDGAPLQGWPDFFFGGAGYPALGEFDEDASRREVFVDYYHGGNGSAPSAALYGLDGAWMPGWPIQIGSNFPPTLADLDGDGVDEILSGLIRRRDASVAPMEGFLVGPAAVGDLDGDEIPEIVSASNTSIWIHDAAGDWVGANPKFDPAAVGTASIQTPVIGDVDADGSPEIVMISKRDGMPWPAQLHVYAFDGTHERTVELPAYVPRATAPALADLTGDGIPEIIVQADDALLALRADGTSLPGFPVALPPLMSNSAPVVGDVDGDGSPDIVFTHHHSGSSPGLLYVLNNQGVAPAGFPKVLPMAGLGMTPAIADIDLDGRNEILVGTTSGTGVSRYIWAYDLGGPAHGPIEWGQLRGGAAHRSYYETGKNLANEAYLGVRAETGGGVTSNVGGIDCGTDCLARVTKGTVVTLTATPDAGGSFAGWLGACAGQGNPCQVAVSRFTSVRASFSTRVLSVTITDPALGTVTSDVGGIDCGSACSAVLAPGAVVTLTATASATGHFQEWTGDCTGSAPTCTVTMSQARTVGATFVAKPRLTVQRFGSGSGTFVSTPAGLDCSTATTCTALFTPGTDVTIVATPDADSEFSGYSAHCAPNVTSCTLHMDRDYSLSFAFTPRPGVAVTVSGGGSGVVTSLPAGINCGADCFEYYPQFTDVTLTAIPAANSVFSHWIGDCSQIGNVCTLRVGQRETIQAVFLLKIPVSVQRDGTGTGHVTSGGAGIDCGADCAELVIPGSDLQLTAIPDVSSDFAGWSIAGCLQPTCTLLSIQSPVNLRATFNLRSFTLSATVAGSGTVTSAPAGIDCGADCAQAYDYGTQVTLTATPGTGQDFQGWSGACTGTAACTVTMTEARGVTATFVPKNFALTVTTSGSGTVTSTPAGISCGADCTETLAYDTAVTLTAAANAGNSFQSWSGACSGSTLTCTVAMTEARSVTATFRANPPAGGGSSSGGGGGGGGGRLDFVLLALGLLLVAGRLRSHAKLPVKSRRD